MPESRDGVLFPDAILRPQDHEWQRLRWYYRPEHGWRALVVEEEPSPHSWTVIDEVLTIDWDTFWREWTDNWAEKDRDWFGPQYWTESPDYD